MALPPGVIEFIGAFTGAGIASLVASRKRLARIETTLAEKLSLMVTKAIVEHEGTCKRPALTLVAGALPVAAQTKSEE